MLGASDALGLDTLLGAFAAGMITRLVLQGAAPESVGEVLAKIEAMGFGFLVPTFSGATGAHSPSSPRRPCPWWWPSRPSVWTKA